MNIESHHPTPKGWSWNHLITNQMVYVNLDHLEGCTPSPYKGGRSLTRFHPLVYEDLLNNQLRLSCYCIYFWNMIVVDTSHDSCKN